MVRGAQAALLGAVVVVACTRGSKVPGESLGTFNCTAVPLDIGCPFRELQADAGFDFTASFSVVDGGPAAYLNIEKVGDVVVNRFRQGTFDGQRFESIYPGPSDDPVTRTFEVGACENRFLVEETFRAVFLTASQFPGDSDGGCPDDPDGGSAVDADGGIPPPMRSLDGYDAMRVCGVMTESIRPAVACDFPACTLTYRIDGTRSE
jgi:hypothetical protein